MDPPTPPKLSERIAWLEGEPLAANGLAKLAIKVGELETSIVLDIRRHHTLFAPTTCLEAIAAKDPNPLHRRAAGAELGQRKRMTTDIEALRAVVASDFDAFMSIEDEAGVVRLFRAWATALSRGEFSMCPASDYAMFHFGAELRALAADFIEAHIARIAIKALYADHRGTDVLRQLLERFPHKRRTVWNVVEKQVNVFEKHFALTDDILNQAKLLVNLSNNSVTKVEVELDTDGSTLRVQVRTYVHRLAKKVGSLEPSIETPSIKAALGALAYLCRVDVAEHPAVAEVVRSFIRRCFDHLKKVGSIGAADLTADAPLVAARLKEWAERDELARACIAGLFPQVKRSKRSPCGWEFVEEHPKKKFKK
jgi:hypothetical protein